MDPNSASAPWAVTAAMPAAAQAARATIKSKAVPSPSASGLFSAANIPPVPQQWGRPPKGVATTATKGKQPVVVAAEQQQQQQSRQTDIPITIGKITNLRAIEDQAQDGPSIEIKDSSSFPPPDMDVARNANPKQQSRKASDAQPAANMEAPAPLSKPTRYLNVKLGVEQDLVQAEGSEAVLGEVLAYAQRVASFGGPQGLDVGQFHLRILFSKVYFYNEKPFSNETSAVAYLREWCKRSGPGKTDPESRWSSDLSSSEDLSVILTATPRKYSAGEIAGLSYVDTSCSSMACSVIVTRGRLRDNVRSDNAGVFNHETVHTLGAWNDGQTEKGNDCKQGFLMGGARNHVLSRCTLRELDKTLDAERLSCLRT